MLCLPLSEYGHFLEPEPLTPRDGSPLRLVVYDARIFIWLYLCIVSPPSPRVGSPSLSARTDSPRYHYLVVESPAETVTTRAGPTPTT